MDPKSDYYRALSGLSGDMKSLSVLVDVLFELKDLRKSSMCACNTPKKTLDKS